MEQDSQIKSILQSIPTMGQSPGIVNKPRHTELAILYCYHTNTHTHTLTHTHAHAHKHAHRFLLVVNYYLPITLLQTNSLELALACVLYIIIACFYYLASTVKPGSQYDAGAASITSIISVVGKSIFSLFLMQPDVTFF